MWWSVLGVAIFKRNCDCGDSGPAPIYAPDHYWTTFRRPHSPPVTPSFDPVMMRAPWSTRRPRRAMGIGHVHPSPFELGGAGEGRHAESAVTSEDRVVERGVAGERDGVPSCVGQEVS